MAVPLRSPLFELGCCRQGIIEKSLQKCITVIPAEAGIYVDHCKKWFAAFAGTTSACVDAVRCVCCPHRRGGGSGVLSLPAGPGHRAVSRRQRHRSSCTLHREPADGTSGTTDRDRQPTGGEW